jgi:HemY protein
MMLWSLLKVLIFIALVAGLTFGVGLLTEMGELATLTVMGREFVLTPLLAVLGALVLLLACGCCSRPSASWSPPCGS